MSPRTIEKPKSTFRKYFGLGAIAFFLALLVGANLFVSYMAGQAAANQFIPPQTVSSMKVEASAWQPEMSSVGSLRAAQGADLAFDVSGLVSRVAVKSGQKVEKGEILVELNADDLIAQRRQLEASAELDKTALARARQQLAYKGISQAEFDRAEATYKVAQARINEQQAMIDKRILRAPFAGRVGIVKHNPGAFVNAGEVVLTVQQIDPLFVDLMVPQSRVGEIAVGQTVMVRAQGQSSVPLAGSVTAISPKLDAATRNVAVEASISNNGERLKPGMFADVAILLGNEESHLTLPQAAITFNPYGETVFLVKHTGKKGPDGKPALPEAQSVFVTTGARRGDQIAILSGIQAGDEVVTSGQLKIKNGTPLIINNTVQPPNEAAPKPQEQ